MFGLISKMDLRAEMDSRSDLADLSEAARRWNDGQQPSLFQTRPETQIQHPPNLITPFYMWHSTQSLVYYSCFHLCYLGLVIIVLGNTGIEFNVRSCRVYLQKRGLLLSGHVESPSGSKINIIRYSRTSTVEDLDRLERWPIQTMRTLLFW